MSGKIISGQYQLKPCFICQKITKNVKFCSRSCFNAARRNVIIEAINTGTYDTTFGDKTLRKYLIAERGHQCQRCFNTEWMGESIPLNVHHIDGDAYNNHSDNLLLLCLNCHGLTANYGNKNKNSSRYYRYKNAAIT